MPFPLSGKLGAPVESIALSEFGIWLTAEILTEGVLTFMGHGNSTPIEKNQVQVS
tara:strand:+ start:159 stop:323 length:165 start_codon:yes stop_codon:yes gene_type:complete